MPVAVPEFQLLLTQLAADLGVKVDRLLARMDRLDQREALSFLTDAYPELAMPYVNLAAQATTVYYADQPATPAAPGQEFIPTIPDELIPADRLAASARWAWLQDKPGPALQGSAMRAVFDGSRDTMIHNVDRERGARWARHASANACGFCRMMATRGAVYRSEEAATTVGGRSLELTLSDRRRLHQGQGFTPLSELDPAAVDEALTRRSQYSNVRAASKAGKLLGDKKTGALRGSRKYGEKYHDHCHCIAVCVRPGDTYQPPPYVEQWDQDYIAATRDMAKAGKTKGDYSAINGTAVASRMEAIDRERRQAAESRMKASGAQQSSAAPNTQAGTDGPRGPKDPGSGGGTGFADPADEPTPWSGHVKGYRHPHGAEVWPEAERVRRQQALGIVPAGEQLFQHEIETVERMHAAGETLQWIPKDTKTFKPTNDIVWVSNTGIEADLKATSAKYSLVKTLIHKAVAAAREAGVIKENFVVDLGESRLTTKLHGQLAKYNTRNPDNPISGLWVIPRGELTQIDLNE